MFTKALPLFLIIGTALAVVPQQPKISAERSLLDFLMQPRGVGTNPALQQYCFNRYLPILKDITDQYEKDYNGCVDSYTVECKGIDAKYDIPYKNVTGTAQETCLALEKCESATTYVDAFDCYETAGSVQSKILFSLSTNAGEFAGQIRELYRTAEFNANVCTNLAEKNYWENTSKTYDEMNNCLDGVIEPEPEPEPESSPAPTVGY